MATPAPAPATFQEANVLELPFADRSFDFVFCNGVLHHTSSPQQGLAEFARMMGEAGYLYLYGTGGFFWSTRQALRTIFRRIPADYAQRTLNMIGMPGNRFIFMDSWYVPIEIHLSRQEVATALAALGLHGTPMPADAPFDPAQGRIRGLPDAEIVWGEEEHRYLTTRASA